MKSGSKVACEPAVFEDLENCESLMGSLGHLPQTEDFSCWEPDQLELMQEMRIKTPPYEMVIEA